MKSKIYVFGQKNGPNNKVLTVKGRLKAEEIFFPGICYTDYLWLRISL